MGTRIAVALSFLIALAASVSAPTTATAQHKAGTDADSARMVTLTGDHYTLHSDYPEAERKEALKVLEACWEPFEDFFGKAPRLKKDERLHIWLFLNQRDWGEKIASDGGGIPTGAGGYYWPTSKAVYLWKQPTLYNTRQLLIHEAAHQFHYLACCNNTNPKDTWYIEGIAESISRHHWDGEKLTLMTIPMVSLADFPRRASELMGADDYDFDAFLRSDRASTRPEQWAVVRYLYLKEPKVWKRVAKKLDQGASAKKILRYLGKPKKLLANIREWLKTQQEPWVYLWNEWQSISDDGLLGYSSVTCAAKLRAKTDYLSATVTPEGERFKVGLLLHHTGGDDYTVAYVTDAGRFTVNRRADGGWTVLTKGDAPEATDGAFAMAAEHRDGKVVWTVQGKELAALELPTEGLGVCLEGARARFTNLTTTRPKPEPKEPSDD